MFGGYKKPCDADFHSSVNVSVFEEVKSTSNEKVVVVGLQQPHVLC